MKSFLVATIFLYDIKLMLLFNNFRDELPESKKDLPSLTQSCAYKKDLAGLTQSFAYGCG